MVYRGFSKAAPDRQLSIKVFKTTSLSERQRAQLRQRIEHLRVLDDRALLTPTTFDIKGGTPFVVQDYFECLSLDEWMRRQATRPLESFFAIACQLAAALDKVHEAGVVHGGVKPTNIFVDATTLETRLEGFVTPLDVRDVSHFFYDPAFLSGTLAYTSPEQTGRIHHVVGFASDLYALGVVFFEILTDRLPFLSTDPLVLIHQHLAEEAPPVYEINEQIPPILGRIVAKLLLKQPEKRYQSGRGLLADLVRCRTEWEVGRSIGRFPLATRDRSRRVVFVSKMVGRDAEARAILDAYEPIARGEFRSLLISGPPGIGKTRLIQELQQSIVRGRGYFTSGKFDIYQKNIPYSSIIQALRNLIRTFLTENEERIAGWRRRILDVVGHSGRVIIDVIPELEALIGPQPAVAPLPLVEARNRFHGLFDRFLGCLASAESPLTLFVDDLQWCDVASFDYLQTVFANPEEHSHLLLLGAYRHNEVDSSHPLAKLLERVKGDGRPIAEICLKPLEPKHCHEMVSYILDAPLSHTEALAAFLADLTEGNPLFVSESLSFLHNEDLLFVDDELQWRWDLERIRHSKMPSTVVALFSSKIGRLPRPTVELLETSACMGNTVAPEDLAQVSDLPLTAVFEALKPALGQGLMIENRGNLQFIHDRVQEAVLTAIPAERRRVLHWLIANRLLAAAGKDANLEALDDLFAIVSHLNFGRPRQLDAAEAWRLAELNFRAGEKALNSLASEAANEFFATSKDLLPSDCWEAGYQKTFQIFKKLAKTELMCGRPEQSEALLGNLLEHARTDLDRAECLAEQTTSLSSIGNFIKAIETANRGLAYFDKSLPDDPEEAERRRARLVGDIHTKHQDVWGAILEMPFTQDRKSKIELAFYSELIPDLYMSGLVPQLYLSAAQSTQHCLSGGMDESVVYSFSIMGLQLGEQEEFEQAFRYEDLARELSARHPNTFGATRGMNGIVWCNMHSRSHPEQIVEYCLRAIQCGRNCGDLYNAGLSYGPLMWNLQVQGADFGAIEEYAAECHRFSERNNLAFSVGLSQAMEAGWVAPMKGQAPSAMDERVERWEADNHVAAAGSYYVHLALSHYYLGEHEQAAQALARVKRYLTGLTDNVLKRQWYVFQGLNALKLHELGGGDRAAVLGEIAALVAKIEKWASLGPLLRPYLALLHAERERVTGDFDQARSLYLRAIEQAHHQRYTFLEGYLNERLGEMQIDSKRGPARPFIREADRLYLRCAAEHKRGLLHERHPRLFEEEPAPVVTTEPQAATPYALLELDVGYLMRSAMAISAEIEQAALLRRIMQTVLESSGAQHGYLLIAEGEHLWVRAESHAGAADSARTLNQRIEDCAGVSKAVVRYVFRTGQRLALADACREGELKDNPEVRALGLRSVLCLPIRKQTRLVGVVYLENRLADGVFTAAGTQTTELLTAQAAISLENARLVDEMRRAEEALSLEREKLAAALSGAGEGASAVPSHRLAAGRPPRVLVIDDDAVSRRLVRAIFAPEGILVSEAVDGEDALAQAAAERPDAVILDLRLPGMGGLEVLTRLRNAEPDLPVIVLTGYGDPKTAVRATQLGAFDYLTKPIDHEELVIVVRRSLEHRALLAEVEDLRRRVGEGSLVEHMGPSPAVRRLSEQVRSVAASTFTVLVQGETGTGKELVAQALHNESPRRDRTLTALDCGAIPEALLESELFGHEKGAFTGAESKKPGRFQLAGGGTLFLDEISNLPLALQAKLLRVLETREVTPLGGGEAAPLDVRFIAATNHDLRDRVREGKFREDLYFRLAQVTISLPALRERTIDIPYLFRRFLSEACLELRRPVPYLPAEAAQLLQQYRWPGNVRELRNIARQAILHSKDLAMDARLVGALLKQATEPRLMGAATPSGASLREVAEAASAKAESSAIREALRAAGGNKSHAAKALRTDYKTLHLKMKRYGIAARDGGE